MTERPQADAAAGTSAAGVSFKPYVLWRRGMLPYSELASLVPERAWAKLAEIEDGLLARQALAERIGDRLYALMPSIPADARARMLQLRRDLHNDRVPRTESADAAEHLLDAGTAAALREWRQARAAAEELRAAAASLLGCEIRDARRRLAAIASGAHFLEGIQLSGPHVYRSVREYCVEAGRDGPLRPSKRLRQTESTILRYACRMALRTAPFGSFTELGAAAWQAPHGAGSNSARRRHVVSLNRSVLAIMAGELTRIDGGDRVLQLRLNNTARLIDGVIDAFARGVKANAAAFFGERVVRVRAVAPVLAVVDALASGPRARPDVVRLLVERGMNAEQASALIDRLVEAGLCHLDTALPDQTRRFAEIIATRLRSAATRAADACADIFDGLQTAEDAFGSASVDERTRVLEDIDSHMKEFVRLSGATMPSAERGLLFEDVAAHGSAHTWRADLLERHSADFRHLHHLLPAFDAATFARLGLYRWFVSRFGEHGRCDDLLTAYRAFAEQSPADIDAVMLGANEPLAEDVRAYQRRVLEHLAEGVAAAGEATTFTLDEESLAQLAAARPTALAPWDEASYRLQIVSDRSHGRPEGRALPVRGTAAADLHVGAFGRDASMAVGADLQVGPPDADPLIVINRITAGHGVFFSRFCDVVEPDDPAAWSLRQSLRETIAREAPRQADLIAVMGLNINLHPALTPLEVVYPGAVASRGDALTLRDLAIAADAERLTLRLVSHRDGLPVDLRPMNFLLPVAAPMLYRFLCALAPLIDYRMGLWDHLRRWAGRDYAYLPRLTLCGLVLERRSWYVPVAEVRALGDPSAAERLDTLIAARRWHERLGIPRECFFRTRRTIARAAPRSWTDETLRTLDIRSARRKRQYLDFRNPLLLRLLLDQAHAADAGSAIVLQECLPATSTYREHAPAAAEELLVETRYSVRNTSAALLAVARQAGTRQAAMADAPSTNTATA